MTAEYKLPAGFEELEPLVDDWALASQVERENRRLTSTTEELESVYETLFPHIRRMMEAVDKYPLGELPEDYGRLFSLALTLAEIAPNVELYGGDIRVVNDFDERRFDARHGHYENWKGLHSYEGGRRF